MGNRADLFYPRNYSLSIRPYSAKCTQNITIIRVTGRCYRYFDPLKIQLVFREHTSIIVINIDIWILSPSKF